MVFTTEQDAFILMAHFRSGIRNEDGSWKYSLQSCIEQFMQEYPEANIDYDTFLNHKCVLVKKFQTKHCICKGKSTGRPTILTKDVIDEIQQKMNQSPTKSLSKLSAETGISVGTCHKAVKKKLHLHRYKVPVSSVKPNERLVSSTLKEDPSPNGLKSFPSGMSIDISHSQPEKSVLTGLNVTKVLSDSKVSNREQISLIKKDSLVPKLGTSQRTNLPHRKGSSDEDVICID